MSDNLKDILSHLSTEVDQETLLKYLEGRLSDEQRHEVEKKMLATDFADDAMEGLQEIKNKQKISSLVEQLNRDLHKKLEKKKREKKNFALRINHGFILPSLLSCFLLL